MDYLITSNCALHASGIYDMEVFYFLIKAETRNLVFEEEGLFVISKTNITAV